MDEDQLAAPSTAPMCSKCLEPLEASWKYCPTCGQSNDLDASQPATISDTNRIVEQQLNARLLGQTVFVRELSDKVEEVFWKRLRILGMALAVVAAGIAFFGYRTVTDVSSSIVTQTKGNVDAITGRLDRLAADIDAQTKRVGDRGGEVDQRLAQLDVTANAAEARMGTYLQLAENISAQMEQRLTQLNTKVDQVSTQVDNATIRQDLPTLGQERFVTYRLSKWDGTKKEAGQKWVAVNLSPLALGFFKQEEIDDLLKYLREAGYTPLTGTFGIGGPYLLGMSHLGFSSNSESHIYYFSPQFEETARSIHTLVLKVLPTAKLDVIYVDPNGVGNISESVSFTLRNSGLDIQIYLAENPK